MQDVAAMFDSKLSHRAPCRIYPQFPSHSFQVFYLDIVQSFTAFYVRGHLSFLVQIIRQKVGGEAELQ